MWSLFTRLVPVLLATVWPPQSPSDLAGNFRQVYNDLGAPGAIYRQVSDTLRFSYVSPPFNGSSTWKEASLEDHLHPDSTKPLAIYLPGLDGYGISAQQYQFDDLARTFEFWRLTVQPEDRSSFLQVVKAVVDFTKKMAQQQDRKVVLIGESCGGLLAAAAALRLDDHLDGLVLVNPATSFDQTAWDRLVPLLTSLRHLDTTESREDGLTPYSVFGSLLLSAMVPDGDQYRRILDLMLNLPQLNIPPMSLDQMSAVAEAMAEAFRETEARLPPEILEHRVQWLVTASEAVNARLSKITTPTVVLVGDQDKLLPSAKEADRLVATLANATKVVVRGRGHFVLDQNVNLTEAILYSEIDPLRWKETRKKFDLIADWRLPIDKVEEAINRLVKPLRTVHSPIYFSTDEKGKRWRGMTKIPRPDGPLLVVGNHQFAAYDLRLFVPDLWEERGIFLRGLAHPVTFFGSRDNPGELHGRTPGVLDSLNPFNGDFQQFGAVEVTPKNYYRLMQTGQDALLFPGGAREALSGRKDYPLFWPDKVDFVRTAARFNATVVPLSAIGMLDSVNVLAEPKELLNAPFIGERIREFSANASGGVRYDGFDADDVLGFPLITPRFPARNYFLFGKAYDLTDVDPMDRTTCERIYREIEADVRKGLDDLMRARKHDPFNDTPRRLAYERVLGKVAPTFPVEELNR